MFSNERLLRLVARGDQPVEEFVPADETDGAGHDGLVKVLVVAREDGLWAELPTVYRRTVPINQDHMLATC